MEQRLRELELRLLNQQQHSLDFNREIVFEPREETPPPSYEQAMELQVGRTQPTLPFYPSSSAETFSVPPPIPPRARGRRRSSAGTRSARSGGSQRNSLPNLDGFSVHEVRTHGAQQFYIIIPEQNDARTHSPHRRRVVISISDSDFEAASDLDLREPSAPPSQECQPPPAHQSSNIPRY